MSGNTTSNYCRRTRVEIEHSACLIYFSNDFESRDVVGGLTVCFDIIYGYHGEMFCDTCTRAGFIRVGDTYDVDFEGGCLVSFFPIELLHKLYNYTTK
jgi:hypothetical protein